jgi:hypothetical protein
MTTERPKKPWLHRLLGWPALLIGAAVLVLGTFVQDGMLALLGGGVLVFAVAEVLAAPSERR